MGRAMKAHGSIRRDRGRRAAGIFPRTLFAGGATDVPPRKNLMPDRHRAAGRYAGGLGQRLSRNSLPRPTRFKEGGHVSCSPSKTIPGNEGGASRAHQERAGRKGRRPLIDDSHGFFYHVSGHANRARDLEGQCMTSWRPADRDPQSRRIPATCAEHAQTGPVQRARPGFIAANGSRWKLSGNAPRMSTMSRCRKPISTAPPSWVR